MKLTAPSAAVKISLLALAISGCASSGSWDQMQSAGTKNHSIDQSSDYQRTVPAEPTLASTYLDSAGEAIVSRVDPQRDLESRRGLSEKSELTGEGFLNKSASEQPVFEDLWERVRYGFALPEINSPLVDRYEKFYRERSGVMFDRGGRYLYHILDEVERRGLPTELALLPFVESAMNPKAVSPAKAAGLWQFMPATGKQYSLSQNWWVDNRRDVVHSTTAALDYLERIHEMHGDWLLALASYNWGENAVARAVKKNRDAGLPTDYMSLTMPEETRHYVPKLLALRRLIQKSGRSEVLLPLLPNKPYFTILEKIKPIDLKLAAKFAGLSVDEFIKLNPSHNRPVISASATDVIILPTDRIEPFSKALADHLASGRVLATWQPTVIKKGETLDMIAKRSGVSESELRRVNSIPARANLLPGTRFLAPHSEVADESMVNKFVAPRLYERVGVSEVRYVVKRKETIKEIAAKFGVDASDIRLWNGLRAEAKVGRSLLVKPASSQTVLTAESGNKEVVQSEILPVKIPKMEASEPARKASSSKKSVSKKTGKKVAPEGKSGPSKKSTAATKAASPKKKSA